MPKATFIQEGKVLDWTNGTGADVAYKDVIAAGGRIFVAAENIAKGATGSVNATGVFELPADNTVVFNTGDALYWDAANNILTKTVGTYKAGYAAAPKAQADAVGSVKID